MNGTDVNESNLKIAAARASARQDIADCRRAGRAAVAAAAGLGLLALAFAAAAALGALAAWLASALAVAAAAGLLAAALRGRRALDALAEGAEGALEALEQAERDRAAAAGRLTNAADDLRAPADATARLLDELSPELPPAQARRLAGAAALSFAWLRDALDAALRPAAPAAGGDRESPFRLGDLAEDAVAIARTFGGADRLRLRCEVSPGVPLVVRADRIRLARILLELLRHAVRVTRSGFVSLVVTSDGGEPSRPWVTLAVVGSGRTAPEARAPELDAGRRLAADLGGALDASSVEGEGCFFSLRVPLAVLEAAPPEGAPASSGIDASLASLVNDLGPEGVRIAVRQFDFDARDLVQRLVDCQAAGDRPGVQKAAHALKGLCRQFGAPGLADAAARLDHNPAAGTPQAAAIVEAIRRDAPAVLAQVSAQTEALTHAHA